MVLVALACGAAPALRASSPDLTALREGGRGSTGRRAWGRDLLVVGQTALALVLLIGSALLVESFQRLRHVNPGYDVRDIYTFQYAPEQPGLRDGPSLGQLHLRVMDRLRALPGVTAVGVVNNIPLDEGTARTRFRTDEMSSDAQPTLLNMNFTGGDYFQAMSIPMLQGRTFSNEEAVTPNTNVVISRSAAEKLWPGPESARAAHPSSLRQPGHARVHRGRRRGRREAERLARCRPGDRLLPAHRTGADGVGHGLAGVRREVAARRDRSSERCARSSASSRPRRRCIASSRWSSSPAAR